jgi:hypothetical protein
VNRGGVIDLGTSTEQIFGAVACPQHESTFQCLLASGQVLKSRVNAGQLSSRFQIVQDSKFVNCSFLAIYYEIHHATFSMQKANGRVRE